METIGFSTISLLPRPTILEGPVSLKGLLSPTFQLIVGTGKPERIAEPDFVSGTRARQSLDILEE